MKVSELIIALQAMPADARVSLLWDGVLRSWAQVCWLAASGEVGIGPWDEVVYDMADRPKGATTENYPKAGELLGVPKPPYEEDWDD